MLIISVGYLVRRCKMCTLNLQAQATPVMSWMCRIHSNPSIPLPTLLFNHSNRKWKFHPLHKPLTHSYSSSKAPVVPYRPPEDVGKSTRSSFRPIEVPFSWKPFSLLQLRLCTRALYGLCIGLCDWSLRRQEFGGLVAREDRMPIEPDTAYRYGLIRVGWLLYRSLMKADKVCLAAR